MDPRPDEVAIEDIAHALSMLCRFGGHCAQFYSVAEHSVRVMIAVKKWNPGRRVVLGALLHDASEAYLIDLPRPIKKNMPEYKRIELGVEMAIFEKYGVREEDWRNPLLKDYDNVLVATEKRDLMPAASLEWAPLPSPLRATIKPWSQKKAKKKFLEAFEGLCG